MKKAPRTSSGMKIADRWNGMSLMQRVQLIQDNVDLFWDLRLVTRSEIEMLLSMPESAQEYIVDREDHPIFTSIDLKKDIEAQIHRDKLEAALRAVFL